LSYAVYAATALGWPALTLTLRHMPTDIIAEDAITDIAIGYAISLKNILPDIVFSLDIIAS
jgi:hypothetical protein